MSKLSRRAKIYIVAVWICAAVITARCAATEQIPDLFALAGLSLFAAASHIFRVRGATERSSYELSWVVFGFTLIRYGMLATIIVVVVAYIAEFLWHKQSWFITLFNIGAFVVTLMAAHLPLDYLGTHMPTGSWQYGFAVVFSVLIFTLVNHLLVGIVLWLARGENLRTSGVFNSLPLLLDLAMIGMGSVAAILWHFAPVVVALILPPLYAMYATLRIPALERRSRQDTKTGLYNARHLSDMLDQEWRRASNFNRPLTVAMIDLDLLRDINNTHGHIAGDAAIISAANVLRRHSRAHDIVARFGGEEFAIVMPETTLNEALPMLEKMRAELEATYITTTTVATPIRATMSLGAACRSTLTATAQDLLHAADVAVNDAKAKGRNRVVAHAM